MQGVAGRQIRKVRQLARHSLVLRDTFDNSITGSQRAIDNVERPGQPHSALVIPNKQTNKHDDNHVILTLNIMSKGH